MDLRSRVVLTALASVTVANSARAEVSLFRPRLELGIAGGAFLPARDHEIFDPKLSAPPSFKRAGLDVSLRLGFYPFEFFGGEVEGAVVPLRTLNDNGGTLFAMRGHGLVQLPYRFTPFLLAGGGFWGMKSGASAVGSDVDPTFHWGAGLKYRYSRSINFRLDGRHIISASRGHGNTDHFELLTGVAFSFGDDGVPAHDPRPIVRPMPLVQVAPPVLQEIKQPEPMQEQAPVELSARQIEVQETREKIEAAFERVHFAWGSFVLRDSDRRALDDAVELLTKHQGLRVEVRGHTDSTGPNRFNERLSQKRALAVVAYLVSCGIDQKRLDARGFGPYHPIDSNATAQGRASNRRGEIIVEDTEDSTVGVKVSVR